MLLLTNGTIATMDPARPMAEAAVVDGAYFAYVGGRADAGDFARRFSRGAWETLDLQGRFVMPGFNDSHLHFIHYVKTKLSVNLFGCTSLAEVQERLRRGLAGLEFAHGIPGTLGGGVMMNAGAYGGELSQTVTAVTYLDREGEEHTIPAAGCEFGYRSSIFARHPDWLILKAEFSLPQGDPEEIREKIQKLFKGYCCGDEETKRVIAAIHEKFGYLIDPHTAVGFSALSQYRAETGDETAAIVASTASPFKFCTDVLDALGVSDRAQGLDVLDQLSQVTGEPVPAPLAALRSKESRFRQTVEKEHMVDAVLGMLE